MNSIAQQPESRGVSPLSVGCGVPRADCRADSTYSTTMNNDNGNQQSSFGRTDSEQQFRTEVQR